MREMVKNRLKTKQGIEYERTKSCVFGYLYGVFERTLLATIARTHVISCHDLTEGFDLGFGFLRRSWGPTREDHGQVCQK